MRPELRTSQSGRLFSIAVLLFGLLASPAFSQIKGGAVTTVLHSDPTGLVLAFTSNGPAQLVASKIYEGLVTYSTDLKPQPSLARSWDISADGLTYTFKLQPNVQWSDGKPFSSADVVFSLAKMLPQTSAGARLALEDVQSVEAPDAQTVVIKLRKPVPYFIMVFPSVALPIMPKHVYDGTDYTKNPANAAPLGTGPFKLAEWRRGSFLRLVRNEHYWKKDRPLVDSITYRIIPDAASRAIALETGDIQIATGLDLSSSDIKQFKASKDFEVTSAGWEYLSQINMLVVNTRKPILNDVRFRQALYYAIDRQLVLDRIWQGVGRIATGPVNSKIPFYTKDVRHYDFDPAKSKALLDQLGFRADANGARSDAGGNRLKVSLVVLPGDERYAQLGQYLREAWKAVGVEVDLQVTDTAGWEDRIRNWDFDILMNSLNQYGDPGFGARRYYVTSNIKKGDMFNNESGYSNPDVDKWFDEANSEMDPAKRANLYGRIQRKLVEDVPVLWLLEVEQLTISNKRVRNVITTAFGPRGPWDELYLAK